MAKKTFLLLVDGSEGFPCALDYASEQARLTGAAVALLAIVEPEGIETWGGVEEAVTDSAFDAARKIMLSYEQSIVDATGSKPFCYYRKGELKATLLSFIDELAEVSALVVGVPSDKTTENPLLTYLTSGKGLRKLTVPLIIVPSCSREAED